MKRRTKRKIKRFLQKNTLVLFIVPLIVSIFCLGTAYSLRKEDLILVGQARIVSRTDIENVCAVGVTYEYIENEWAPNLLQVNFTFSNDSEDDMSSIVVRLTKTGTYSLGWANGFQVTQDDDYYYLEFEPWFFASQLGAEPDGSVRTKLHPGESVSTTIAVNHDGNLSLDSFLQLFSLTNCGQYDEQEEYTEVRHGGAVLYLTDAEQELTDVTIEFSEYADYNYQVVYKVTVTNTFDVVIDDWRINIYFGDDKDYFAFWPWLFEHTNVLENSVTLDALSAELAPGESREFFIAFIPKDPQFDEDGNYVPDTDFVPDMVLAVILKGRSG